MAAHAWVAFHDGSGWREIDPSAGQLAVGADHVEASLIDFVALASLGLLEVTEVH